MLAFAFWSISFTLVHLYQGGDSVIYILAIYGTCLVMLVMGGFFYFFLTNKLGSNILKSGLLFMVGSIIFFISDNCLAHGKFDTVYRDLISQRTNTFLIMITYYVAQFFIGKGTFLVAVHYCEEKSIK